MKYLPFGETLVDEHLNSYNSPFKYNAKEYDAETGNYYYGARYYDPKWSIFISVDPLTEGYKGTYGIRNLDENTSAITTKDNVVIFNKNHLKEGQFDNSNDMGSYLDHEANLDYGHKGEKRGDNYTYLDHSKVYLGQSTAKDFNKTSTEIQYSTAVNFASRLFASTQVESGLNVLSFINDYNKNNGDVKILSINTNNGMATFNIAGESQTIKLIIPKTPND